MSTSGPTFNLSALADRLVRERRMLPFAGRIRRARDLHSLATDLVMAVESLDALDAELLVAAHPDDHRKLITEAALLNNALVLYVRATKTVSKERDGYDLRSRFSDDERFVHREMSDLRDHAIAHFGSGGSYRGEWQAELVILHFESGEARPGVVTRRQTVDRDLVRRARAQVETALRLLRDVYHAKLTEIVADLEMEAARDPGFHREIGQHPLNLDVFMKSSKAADAARRRICHGKRQSPLSGRSRRDPRVASMPASATFLDDAPPVGMPRPFGGTVPPSDPDASRPQGARGRRRPRTDERTGRASPAPMPTGIAVAPRSVGVLMGASAPHARPTHADHVSRAGPRSASSGS